MLLTFTRRASDEMLRRARRALGETGSRTLGAAPFTPLPAGCFAPMGKPSGSIRILRWWINRMPRDLMDASRQDHALGSKEKRFPRKQTCLSIYSRCVNSTDRLDLRTNGSITSWWTNIRTPTACSPQFSIA